MFGRQVHPAPSNDLQVGKIGLLLLIDGGGLVLKLAGGLHDDEGRTSDQVMGLEKPVNTGLRDEVALRLGISYRTNR